MFIVRLPCECDPDPSWMLLAVVELDREGGLFASPQLWHEGRKRYRLIAKRVIEAELIRVERFHHKGL